MMNLYPDFAMKFSVFNRLFYMPVLYITRYVSVLLMGGLLFFTSCEDKGTLIGENLQPENDKFSVKYYDDFPVEMYTGSLDSIRSDEATLATAGELIDPVFGTTKADFLSQIRLSGELVFDDYENLVIDSLIVFLEVQDQYGDTNSVMEINVHELKRDVYLDSSYYSNLNQDGLYYDDVLGSASYSSSDTLIKIMLDNTFAEKIISDTTILDSQEDFLQEIKGLYFTSDIQSGKGILTNFKLLSLTTEVIFAFHYESSDTLFYNFSISQSSARINMYSNDYSTADPSYKILHLDDNIEDSVSYIQGLSGVYTKVCFPTLEDWRDSLPIGINNAELTINLSQDIPSFADFEPPEYLDINVRDKEGNFIPITDLVLGRNYFGGNLTDGFYSFTVSDFIHQYLNGYYYEPILYIFVNQSNYKPERTVLSGYDHSEKAQLQMTYTR